MHQEKRVDLHTHSTFSDGVLTPTELIDVAKRKGLAAIALSDHDAVEGFPELAEAAAGEGIEVISGVELSCEHNGRDLHILGYGVNVEDTRLLDALNQFCVAREERGVKIVEKLLEQGVKLDMDAILARSGKGALGRPHIAEALVEGGYASDFAEVFAKYIGEDCPAYVEKYKMSPTEAVSRIHDAGGLAFVAHPGYYLEDVDVFHGLIDEGFDGIEVLHPHHKGSTSEKLHQIAQERSLMISGGSDFHGFKGRDNMGEPHVPYELFEKIRERLN